MKKNKTSVHFVVLSLNERTGGGSHHNVISFIRFLKRNNYDVVVHTLTSTNNDPPEDIEIIQHSVHLSFFSMMKSTISLMKEYEDSADLFFLYGTDFSWIGGKYRIKGGRSPVVVYLDNYLSSMRLGQWHGLYYFLKRFLWDKFIGLRYIKHTDCFFAVSPFLKNQYIKFGFPEENTYLMPNFFQLEKQTINNAHTNQNRPVHLLYAGRLTHDKGTDLLLEAVSELPDKMNWQLRIVGDGPLRKKCVDFISVNKLESKIHLVPWLGREELSDEYKKADIFVHPARWPEPFGRTIVEALQAGVPVIVPSQGGSSWIAKGAGLEFTNGDKDSFKKVLATLIKSKKLRATFSEKGKERILMFSEASVGKLFLSQIDDLL